MIPVQGFLGISLPIGVSVTWAPSLLELHLLWFLRVLSIYLANRDTERGEDCLRRVTLFSLEITYVTSSHTVLARNQLSDPPLICTRGWEISLDVGPGSW